MAFLRIRRESGLSLSNSLRLDAADDACCRICTSSIVPSRWRRRRMMRNGPSDWCSRELAARYENSPEYDVKRSLWRGVLRGAFINPQGDADAERDLFARHTMLVVIARAVAETLRPPDRQAANREQLHDTLTEGFAAWLLEISERAPWTSWLPKSISTNGAPAPGYLERPVPLRHCPRNSPRLREYYTPDWPSGSV